MLRLKKPLKLKDKNNNSGNQRFRNSTNKSNLDIVFVSGPFLLEVQTVLQTQEPVIKPSWNTFASSISGIWKGVGAVFSPITAEMEPIDIGKKNEYLFDCYTVSHIEAVTTPSWHKKTQIQRKINWITLNPHGEVKELDWDGFKSKENYTNEDASMSMKNNSDEKLKNYVLPKFESFDFGKSDIMEEDVMGCEPGLVFFEDGSYSRGPVDIPISEFDETAYYISPTIKFEQCLVKGCHKRLRLVHTIEFSSGGSDIRTLRVAVFEEKWSSPANISHQSDLELDVKPFSQRKRVQPGELTGSWKVFEVSATPIYDEETISVESNDAPYVYLCMENLNKRSLPENMTYFGEEEVTDFHEATVLYLPGGVTAYVDVKKDGILCIGFGWYSDEGINLVMERDYGTDGTLKEVRSKSEVKRRWSTPPPV
ncbi:hypothetical protein Leryth_027037 [Lithospermum erythrorhizon]|nr:hypothetical protein Leryth_027037 [Lithospermum erythrorhizon]